MPEYTLTVIDTTQIQQYVFGSNRLAENVGASELVEKATHKWVYDALPAPSNMVLQADKWQLDNARRIEIDDIVPPIYAEIVYAGGGNTVILFRTRKLAEEFTKELTRNVLLQAPGLELVVSHSTLDWTNHSLALAVQNLLGPVLSAKKADRVPSLPLLGMSVTAACRSTGLAAVTTRRQGETQQLVSREISCKLAKTAEPAARRRLEDLLPRLRDGKWLIPPSFDNLGRIEGEDGYIAVVHADGNGMGKRIAELASQYATPEQNRAYITAIRDLSQAVEYASVAALRAATDLLADALLVDPTLPAALPHFPFRPIVFGGDDVTFVCNGRYGLPLAVRYLEAFEEATAASPAFGFRAAHACAGVALVKLHYPFSRAYQLSDALCRSAKRYVRDMALDASALDWQFAIAGITRRLPQLRDHEYTVRLKSGKYGRLNARPLLLKTSTDTWRSWPVIDAILAQLNKETGDWYERRNKVKALREALRRGPEAVEDFLHTYRLYDEGLPASREIPVRVAAKTGWDGDSTCVYFDPIEAMDFYTDLAAIAARVQQGGA